MELQIDNESCVELSSQQYWHLALARGLTGTSCFVLSTVILIVMVIGMYRSRFTRGLLEWIVLYLSALTMIDDILFLILVFPTLAEWSGFCRALGIAMEIVNWVQIGCTIILAIHQLYLLYQVITTERYPYMSLTDHREQTRRHTKMIKRFHYGALLAIWMPLLVSVVWLPFESGNEYHEEESEWCWIVSVTDDCEKEAVEFSKELIVWYIPVLVVTCVTACTTLATLAVWVYTSYKNHYNGDNVVENYRPSNLMTLITFGLFTVTSTVEVGVRTFTIMYRKHNYVLWMIFAVVTPFRDVILPVGYSIQSYLYRKQNRQAQVQSPEADKHSINASSNMAHFQPTDTD